MLEQEIQGFQAKIKIYENRVAELLENVEIENRKNNELFFNSIQEKSELQENANKGTYFYDASGTCI